MCERCSFGESQTSPLIVENEPQSPTWILNYDPNDDLLTSTQCLSAIFPPVTVTGITLLYFH